MNRDNGAEFAAVFAIMLVSLLLGFLLAWIVHL